MYATIDGIAYWLSERLILLFFFKI